MGEERGDAGLRIGAQQRKILERAAGGIAKDRGNQQLEAERFGILVVGLAPVEGDIALAGRALVAEHDLVVAKE
ncbi:hypothetical protein D3C87_1972050 [compost metagenome]